MAQMTEGRYKTFQAGADLSAKQYHLVKLDANGNVVPASSSTDKVIGVLINKPGNGEPANVALPFGGTVKVKLGGAVNRGDYLTSDANGQAIATTTTGDLVFGIALEAGASGDVVEMLPVFLKI